MNRFNLNCWSGFLDPPEQLHGEGGKVNDQFGKPVY